ncbi:MBL fold metallo-hydrolase [Parachlamydia sp. AcF125]|uniref:MBL fold metallo-hydrolase n=1 Tax=Parachlamydia sp. AcF125 TaxID=2795736 RepID=UPI001BC9C768|nr:MBL fold metallo-hydrolase [Parachlamydia sp. AcF125]
MIISAFPTGPFETNAYVIGCPKTHQAAIIDPGVGSAKVIASYLASQGLTPTFILLTHSHWDHIAEVLPLKNQYHIPVAIHPLDSPNLEHPGSDGLPCWIAFEGVIPDQFLDEGQQITVGQAIFTVIHTPGHSPGSVCFYCPQEHLLISGDTLFQGTIGNLSFPTSQPEKMWNSLDKLTQLPASTKVYPGHGLETTIGAESWLPNARKLFDHH